MIAVALAGSAGAATAPDDWTAFRGGSRNGIVAAKIPATWSDSQNVKWKAALPGPGSSSPIVSGDRVFVTCYSGYGTVRADGGPETLQRHLLCLDRKDGKMLWSKAVPAVQPEDPYQGYLTEHGYASSTPATDGERVFVFFGKSGVLAFDFSGKQLWRTDVGRSSSNRQWGSASSPLIYKKLLIVNAADESRTLRALDVATGKEQWKVNSAKMELAYGTPALVSQPDGRTELVIAVPNEVWAFDPDTGKNTWYAAINMGGNICPSVTPGPGVVYVTGGFPTGGCVAIRGGGTGDVSRTHVLWSSSYTSYVPTPVYYQDRLYWVNEQGIAHCLDAKSGALLYQERLRTDASSQRPRVYASTLVVGDHLLTVSRNLGTFILATGPKFEQLALNHFAGDPSTCNATPAISGNELFLRSNRFLYCIAGK